MAKTTPKPTTESGGGAEDPRFACPYCQQQPCGCSTTTSPTKSDIRTRS
jgi:hypothetical protein